MCAGQCPNVTETLLIFRDNSYGVIIVLEEVVKRVGELNR